MVNLANMLDPLNKKVVLYSSLFITAVICFPQLLRQQSDSLRNLFIPFSWDEWVLRVVVEFVFCISIFYVNKHRISLFRGKWRFFKDIRPLLINVGLFLAFSIVGGGISRLFIRQGLLPLNGYFLRLGMTLFFILVEIRILSTWYYAVQKEKENEQLRRTNTQMELEILKEQINPHFLFNTLSSLSGIIREDPAKAQAFVAHLSKLFRHSLSHKHQHLVTLGEELEKLTSYQELMNMRMENSFRLVNNIPEACYDKLLPQTSLLPLIENALKHNVATPDKPLIVTMSAQDGALVVDNNLQPNAFPEPGNGIGLTNLNERFRLLLQTEISILKTEHHFSVKLPLQI